MWTSILPPNWLHESADIIIFPPWSERTRNGIPFLLVPSIKVNMTVSARLFIAHFRKTTSLEKLSIPPWTTNPQWISLCNPSMRHSALGPGTSYWYLGCIARQRRAVLIGSMRRMISLTWSWGTSIPLEWRMPITIISLPTIFKFCFYAFLLLEIDVRNNGKSTSSEIIINLFQPPP